VSVSKLWHRKFADLSVSRLFKVYLSKPEWVADVQRADAIFVATHVSISIVLAISASSLLHIIVQSQGCIVAAHLLARIIKNGHIHTSQSVKRTKPGEQKSDDDAKGIETDPSRKMARVALLSMCGVHLGPFYNSSTSTVITPYLWFEHPSAR
jgi:hypothetical protein